MAKAKKARKNPSLRERTLILEKDAKIVEQLLAQHGGDLEQHRTQLKNLGERVARLEAGAAPQAEPEIRGFDVPRTKTDVVRHWQHKQTEPAVSTREQFNQAVRRAKFDGYALGQLIHWLSDSFA
jgi:hypothetical protein